MRPTDGFLRRCEVNLIRVLEMLLFVCVMTMLVLVVLQVLSRYVFHASISWTEEITRVALIWTVMLGASVAAWRRAHYTITLVSGRLKGSARRIALVLTNALSFAFAAAMVWFGTEYAAANVDTQYVAASLSRAWAYAALPIGALLICLALLHQSAQAWCSREALDET